jgi:hypothetical protein
MHAARCEGIVIKNRASGVITNHDAIKSGSVFKMLYTRCEIRGKMKENGQVLPFEKGRFAHLKKV